ILPDAERGVPVAPPVHQPRRGVPQDRGVAREVPHRAPAFGARLPHTEGVRGDVSGLSCTETRGTLQGGNRGDGAEQLTQRLDGAATERECQSKRSYANSERGRDLNREHGRGRADQRAVAQALFEKILETQPSDPVEVRARSL